MGCVNPFEAPSKPLAELLRKGCRRGISETVGGYRTGRGVRAGSGNVEFTPILGAFVKNEATETEGEGNGTVLTLWLNIQIELKKWRSKPSKSAIDKSVNGL